MAKIGALPGKDVIDAFRGKLDFYTWCELKIVRKWPRAPGRKRAPAVVAAQAPFAYINKLAGSLPASVVESYQELAQASSLSWKDFLNRLYINATIEDHPIPTDEDYVLSSEKPMRIYILDPEVQKAVHNNIAVSVPWTDIDLTAEVPLAATHAIIRAKLQCNSGAAVNDYGITLREKGATQGVDCVHWWAGVTTAFCCINDSIVPLDANNKIQYKVDIPGGGGSVFVNIWIVGYWYEVG